MYYYSQENKFATGNANTGRAGIDNLQWSDVSLQWKMESTKPISSLHHWDQKHHPTSPSWPPPPAFPTPQLPCFKLKIIPNSRVATQLQPVHGSIAHHGHGHPQSSVQELNISAPSQERLLLKVSLPSPPGPVWPKLSCSHKTATAANEKGLRAGGEEGAGTLMGRKAQERSRSWSLSPMQ